MCYGICFVEQNSQTLVSESNQTHNAGGYMAYLNEEKKMPVNQWNIKTLPPECRPDERMELYGAEALSDAELLAVIIRTGYQGTNSIRLAESILGYTTEAGLTGLCQVSIEELKQMRGVGKVKAFQIKAVAELARRISKQSAKQRFVADNPQTVARYYMEDLRHKDTECVMVLSLDGKGALLGEKILSMGTVNASLASPREIFLEAFKQKAVSILMLHNHPSGDATPSRQDIELTNRIKKSGELLGVALVDHIIIGDNTYVSLKEKELI